MPPAWTYGAGVGFFIGDANDYYRKLNQALLDRSQQSSQAAALARQLTASATNRLDVVKAIRDFVAKSIRLAGPTFTELPLSELSAADTTLADGYGHLADRAILFHALLTAAGFHPEFVLASELPPLTGITGVAKTFPLPQDFQYPLVKVVVAGQAYYLNDTDQYSQLGATAHDGRLGLVLASRASTEIHAAKNCGNAMKTLYTLSVTDTGRTRVGVTRYYYGGGYGAKNHFFSELPPEECRRYFQETFRRWRRVPGPSAASRRNSTAIPASNSSPWTWIITPWWTENICISTCRSRPRCSRSAMITACCRCSFLKAVRDHPH